jgi:signal peptidase I
MPDSQTTAPVPVPAALSAETWEHRLPDWQQWLNSFCENWIFAFIIAMAIRHFCLEAFRIPTASMEPMLYGDPAFAKADHVVVDKFLFRFTGPSRWGVTVFQFPQPEIEPRPGEHTDARTAVAADGARLDAVLVRPLMYRNFVKRAVILPGDTYYIAGGNIYLKQPDGSFQASRKPASVQSELWQEVYRFGVQADYQPWSGDGGATAATVDGGLRLALAPGGTVSLLPQQFRNLYLKDGTFLVSPRGGAPGAGEPVTISMTSPQFTYRRSNRTGVAWDLDHWEVRRMNSADLDHYSAGDLSAGTELNRTMTEWVGDVRFRGQVRELTGQVALELAQGMLHTYRLELSPGGWALLGDGRKLGSGGETVVGTTLAFAHLAARWSGSGTLTFSALSLDRDVHYTLGHDGSFLRNEAGTFAQLKARVEVAANDSYMPPFERDMQAKALRDLLGVRAQMLGKPIDQLAGSDQYAAIGCSPETALTAPPGAYLMMGDNSPQSWDSRCWGYVASENLRGRVLAVVLPISRWRVVR